jgi:hypothetical protein
MENKPRTVQAAENMLLNIHTLQDQLKNLRFDPKYTSVVCDPIVKAALEKAEKQATSDEKEIYQLNIKE